MNKQYLVLNVSPRKQGTSAMLSEESKKHLQKQNRKPVCMNLYDHLDDLSAIIQAVDNTDIIVICGPCYVNSYPADVVNFLEQLTIRIHFRKEQKLYGIIQGGMPYAHTHKSGLNMLQVFCEKVGMEYCGGFIMGLGPVIDGGDFSKLPNGRKVKRQFTVFLDHVFQGIVSDDGVYEKSLMRFPAFLAKIMARFMNRSIDRSYQALGLNAYDPSPYLSDELK